MITQKELAKASGAPRLVEYDFKSDKRFCKGFKRLSIFLIVDVIIVINFITVLQPDMSQLILVHEFAINH